MSAVLGWRPDVLAAAADALTAARTQLAALDGDVEAARPPRTWQGAAAEAARAQFRVLDADYLDHVAEVTVVVAALDEAATTIQRALRDIDTALAAIRGRGWSVVIVGDAVNCTPPPASDGDLLAPLDRPAIVELTTQITDAIAAARNADAALAAALASVANGEVDTTAQSAPRAALPPELRALSTPELLELALADPGAVAPYAEFLTTAQREAITARLTTENLAVAQLGVEPVTGGDGERVLRIAGATAAFAADPGIAAGVLERLGPEGFLDAQLTAQPWSTSLGDVTAGGPVGAHQNAMRALLARGDALDPVWAERLVAHAGATTYDAPDGSAGVNGLQVLGPLLAGEGHATHLLTAAGGAILDHERAVLAANGGEPHPWSPDGSTWRTDLGGERGTGADPLVGVLDGMAHTPDAATAFVLDLAPAGDGTDFATYDGSELAYLLKDRAWPDEVGGSLVGHEALRDTLAAAVTPDAGYAPGPGDDPRSPGTRAAEAIVGVAGSDVDHAGSLTAPLAEGYAAVLATHVNDVFGAYNPLAEASPADAIPGWYDPPWGHADFATAALDNVLPAIGGHPEAGAMLAQQTRAYAETGLLTTLRGVEQLDAGGWEDRVEHARLTYVEELGTVRGHLADGYAAAAAANQEASDAHANERGFFEALEHGTGYALTIGAGEVVNTATERYGLAGPLSGVLGDVVNAGVDWSVTELFEGPPSVNTSRESAWQTSLDLDGLRLQNTLVINNAVYESVPVEDLPDELRTDDGGRVRMTEMTTQQQNLWAAHALSGTSRWSSAATALAMAEDRGSRTGGGS
ncbi:hypothetical protein [Nocardioides zeae]|uniref:Uncharacterized protein n=1 Tax=Nocardioides zeae TaxID=1457234 RepID=A0A6P0HLC0_9ACTN|nr:hypothetical protein [Nocardioides zeae]NEN79472.1 hypothetical protein [Nocardioides zeae]